MIYVFVVSSILATTFVLIEEKGQGQGALVLFNQGSKCIETLVLGCKIDDHLSSESDESEFLAASAPMSYILAPAAPAGLLPWAAED